MKPTYLTHHFLIAMPRLRGTLFANALIYVCEHTDKGGLGLIVNRTIDLTLENLCVQVNMAPDAANKPLLAAQMVHFGGPMQRDRGFVLHTPTGDWESTMIDNGHTALTTSRDVLANIATQSGETEAYLVALGASSWDSEQLEGEIAKNDWLTVPADLQILFHTPPEKRLAAAMQKLGVDVGSLSTETGHA